MAHKICKTRCYPSLFIHDYAPHKHTQHIVCSPFIVVFFASAIHSACLFVRRHFSVGLISKHLPHASSAAAEKNNTQLDSCLSSRCENVIANCFNRLWPIDGFTIAQLCELYSIHFRLKIRVARSFVFSFIHFLHIKYTQSVSAANWSGDWLAHEYSNDICFFTEKCRAHRTTE